MMYVLFANLYHLIEPLEWFFPPDMDGGAMPQLVHPFLHTEYMPYIFLLHLLLDGYLLYNVFEKPTQKKWMASYDGFTGGTFFLCAGIPIFDSPALIVASNSNPMVLFPLSVVGFYACLVFVRAFFLLYTFDDVKVDILFFKLLPTQFVIVVLVVWSWSGMVPTRWMMYSGKPWDKMETATKKLRNYYKKHKTLPFLGRKETCTFPNHSKVGRTYVRKVCFFENNAPISKEQASLRVLGWDVKRRGVVRLCYAAHREKGVIKFRISGYVNRYCSSHDMSWKRTGEINKQGTFSNSNIHSLGPVFK
ncbi:MAG TPA: hypothetical protein DCE42_05410 [Myxococcales bacterium]|mgnify:FL=1|nr:hypothetical protein [Myxococcales bacterium]